MKKCVSILAIVVFILFMHVTITSAASIGMQSSLVSKDYISLSSSIRLFSYNVNTLESPWSFSVSGKYTLLPSLYIRFSDELSRNSNYMPPYPAIDLRNDASLNLSYILGNNLVFDLKLGSISNFKSSSSGSMSLGFKFNYGLTIEYLFLNMPTYQVGLSALASNISANISLLGAYDLSENLELEGNGRLSYNYTDKAFDTTVWTELSYKKNLLIARLSYERNDLSNQKTPTAKDNLSLTLSSRLPIENFTLTAKLSYKRNDLSNQNIASTKDTLSLSLTSRLPIITNLTAALNGSFSLHNVISTAKELYILFDASADVEYTIITGLKLTLSYNFKRNRRSLPSNPYYYSHSISLRASYRFDI